MLVRHPAESTSVEDREPAAADAQSKTAHGPRQGDVVITRDVSEQRPRYTARQFDGLPQFSCDSLEKALKAAGSFARRRDVGIWENNRGAFTSVAPRGHRGR